MGGGVRASTRPPYRGSPVLAGPNAAAQRYEGGVTLSRRPRTNRASATSGRLRHSWNLGSGPRRGRPRPNPSAADQAARGKIGSRPHGEQTSQFGPLSVRPCRGTSLVAHANLCHPPQSGFASTRHNAEGDGASSRPGLDGGLGTLSGPETFSPNGRPRPAYGPPCRPRG